MDDLGWPGSSPAGLGSEWHLAVSTSCRLSEVRAGPAEEATQRAVSAGTPSPERGRGGRPSQPRGCRGKSRLIMSRPKGRHSFYQMSWETNTRQGLRVTEEPAATVAPAPPPGSLRRPSALEPTPRLCVCAASLWLCGPAMPRQAVPEVATSGQTGNCPDHSGPRASGFSEMGLASSSMEV